MTPTFSDELVRLSLVRKALKTTPRPGTLLLGPDEFDDAAVIQVSEDVSLIIASDFVRGTGFRLHKKGLLNHFDVGYYLVAANLSDLAAMGAMPSGLTTVVRYGPSMSDQQFSEVFDGIATAATQFEAPIVGGDIGSYESDVLAATAFGFMNSERVLRRSAVCPGDSVCVTGTIGRAVAALAYFSADHVRHRLSTDTEEALLNAWRRPVPRLAAGATLSNRRLANACQDVSDGLRATLEQLSQISGQNFAIWPARIPIDPIVHEVARVLDLDVLELAMSGSVDFELVFTTPSHLFTACQEALAVHGVQCSEIGRVTNCSYTHFEHSDGRHTELSGVPWRHQADIPLPGNHSERTE